MRLLPAEDTPTTAEVWRRRIAVEPAGVNVDGDTVQADLELLDAMRWACAATGDDDDQPRPVAAFVSPGCAASQPPSVGRTANGHPHSTPKPSEGTRRSRADRARSVTREGAWLSRFGTIREDLYKAMNRFTRGRSLVRFQPRP
jgi:hypothetical protein